MITKKDIYELSSTGLDILEDAIKEVREGRAQWPTRTVFEISKGRSSYMREAFATLGDAIEGLQNKLAVDMGEKENQDPDRICQSLMNEWNITWRIERYNPEGDSQ